MTATVDIKQLSHRYGDFTALNNINLRIEAGSYAVLLGPSGCGKTTLLSVLGGFLHPATGTVLLDGTDITHVPPAKRSTTTMFQDYALFPHMSLLDNVGFGLRMRGQAKTQRRSKALELLALTGLEDSARKKPHMLSGGQRQRVALARALAVEPQVLLLDEPLGALDLKLRRQMQHELKSIQKRVGTTFIHVTHDQEEAMAIADQIIVMNAGQVEDTGTPESIYLKPLTAFSAAFMGDANFVDATVLGMDEREIRVQLASQQLTLPGRSNVHNNISVGDAVRICFRPEHIRVDTPDSPAESAGVVSLGLVTVDDVAFFGAHRRCRVVAANGQPWLVHLPQTYPVTIADKFPLTISKDSLLLLRSD